MAVVQTEDRDGVRWVWMNRPERRNALSGELIEALHVALGEARDDGGVRCVVLAGRGAGFCAGGDLAGGMTPEGGVLAGDQQRGRYGELLLAIQQLPVPVVACVHGDALGGGLGLVAACDIVVADEAARFGTPEIKVGLFPLVITAVLQRTVPRKALLEMMFTGEKLSATEAARVGLVNRVAAAGEAPAVAGALATSIAGNSRAILGLGKRSFYDAADLDVASAVRLLQGRLTLNLLAEDAGEGISAFLSKRPPAWKHR